MDRDTRRGLRVVLTVIHLALQIVMVVLFYSLQGPVNAQEQSDLLIKALVYLGFMLGLFFVYYSLMKIFSGRNIPYH